MTCSDPRAAALALTCVAQIGPGTLRRLMDRHGPLELWHRVLRADLAPPPGVPRPREWGSRLAGWQASARNIDPDQVAERARQLGATVLLLGDDAMPAALSSDRDAPPVLCHTGDLSILDGPVVAIVGTRAASSLGRSVAAEMAGDLAASGITVVSGLALGIDAAAHAGALDAGGATAAVVGSGLDVVYPRANRDLWHQIASSGVMISECAPGVRPEPWRFPRRNRLIAALAQVVVVVESRSTGGSLLTVHEALRRDRTVMAVPGSVRSAAAAGTNDLLADGAEVARDANDVLVALGLASGNRHRGESGIEPAAAGSVLAALDAGPLDLDALALAVNRTVGEVAVEVMGLRARGEVADVGGYLERVHP